MAVGAQRHRMCARERALPPLAAHRARHVQAGTRLRGADADALCRVQAQQRRIGLGGLRGHVAVRRRGASTYQQRVACAAKLEAPRGALGVVVAEEADQRIVAGRRVDFEAALHGLAEPLVAHIEHRVDQVGEMVLVGQCALAEIAFQGFPVPTGHVAPARKTSVRAGPR
ncbi:hypothetical protein D3C87_1630010 [compost metagenome]